LQLVDCKTIEEAGATGFDQVPLATASATMRRVPRRIASTDSIGVTDLRRAFRFTRPIVACVIGIVRKRAAIELRAGKDVVLVGRISDAVYNFAALIQRRSLVEIAAKLRLRKRVAMQLVLIG
jgi:hypothetical protein